MIADASHLRVGVAPQAKRGRVGGDICPSEAANLDVLGRRVRLHVTRGAVDKLPIERIDVAGGASDPCVLRAHGDREGGMIEWRRTASRMAAEAGRGVGGETGNPGMAAGDTIELFAVTGCAVSLPEVLSPRLVGPGRGVASEAWLLVVRGSQAHVERRVQRYWRDVIRRCGRHGDRHLRVSVALQAELGGPGRGR